MLRPKPAPNVVAARHLNPKPHGRRARDDGQRAGEHLGHRGQHTEGNGPTAATETHGCCQQSATRNRSEGQSQSAIQRISQPNRQRHRLRWRGNHHHTRCHPNQPPRNLRRR